MATVIWLVLNHTTGHRPTFPESLYDSGWVAGSLRPSYAEEKYKSLSFFIISITFSLPRQLQRKEISQFLEFSHQMEHEALCSGHSI